MRPLIEELPALEEHVAHRYPRDIQLGDTAVTLTPMVPSDWPYMQGLLNATPAAERRYFRHDVSDADRVHQWCSDLDYRYVLPLLAWSGDRVVADAILQQEPGFWTAHVGMIRILVDPDFRGQGLGAHLIRELIELAGDLGLHKLAYECSAEQNDLMLFLRRMYFTEAARLPDFIRDRDGKFHDMVLMVYSLT